MFLLKEGMTQFLFGRILLELMHTKLQSILKEIVYRIVTYGTEPNRR